VSGVAGPDIARSEGMTNRPALELVRRAGALQREYPLAQLAALLLLFCLGAATISGFTQMFSIRSMLILASLLGISALGQTVCVLIGGLDVSVGGWILAGSTVSVGLLDGAGAHWSIAEVFLLLGFGSVIIGGLAGLVSYRFGVPSLVVTLAVNGIVTGVVLAWDSSLTGTAPPWIATATSAAGRTFGIAMPSVVFIWAAIAVISYVVLQRSVVGTWIHATGGNPRAAKLAMIPTTAVWIGAFGLSALAATLAGVLLTGFSAGGGTGVGTTYMWNGLTAVIIGGTAFGAQGDYTRTVIGSLVIIVLSQVLTGYGVGSADQSILFGALIIVIVGLYLRDRRLRDQI